MNYSVSSPVTAVAPKEPSLMADASVIVDRLHNIEARLQKLSDYLYGPYPRDASSASVPEPMPSVRRHVDKMSSLLDSIDGALESIERRS